MCQPWPPNEHLLICTPGGTYIPEVETCCRDCGVVCCCCCCCCWDLGGTYVPDVVTLLFACNQQTVNENAFTFTRIHMNNIHIPLDSNLNALHTHSCTWRLTYFCVCLCLVAWWYGGRTGSNNTDGALNIWKFERSDSWFRETRLATTFTTTDEKLLHFLSWGEREKKKRNTGE